MLKFIPFALPDIGNDEINGKYDLIIAKSVLGGIFREDKSSVNDVNELINNILENNIKQRGGC